MQSSINRPARADAEHAPTGASRLRTVTGNRFPRKCSCGCGQPIPRDPEVRYVVDFGAPRPYPAYFREHSPDFGSPFNRRPARKPADNAPAFIPAGAVGAPPTPSPRSGSGLGLTGHVARRGAGGLPAPRPH